MPHRTLKGHRDWVLACAWSPDGTRLASGSRDGQLIIWDPATGKASPRKLGRGHSKWITSITWQPLHLRHDGTNKKLRLATASKDGMVKIWNGLTGQVESSLSGHTASVTCLLWGGNDHLYSGSQDRTVRVWSATDGRLLNVLEGHGHWVNSLALSTGYVLRTGAYNPSERRVQRDDESKSTTSDVEKALQRYRKACASTQGRERLVSCSDDFTLLIWDPEKSAKPVARLTGHQQPINAISCSPDGRWLASASFDHSVRLWDATTGKFSCTLRGHVQAVYHVAWSADSRLLVSASRDSTVKVWEVATKKLLADLPGHADEVFACDWSPDGARVASGGVG